METIESVTIKFHDGSEIKLSKAQFEELKNSFKEYVYYPNGTIQWPTYHGPCEPYYTVTCYSTGDGVSGNKE